MKIFDLIGGVEKVLTRLKNKTEIKKISASILTLNQAALAVLPAVLPVNSPIIDPATLLTGKENASTIEIITEAPVPQVILSVSDEGVIEIPAEKKFKIVKVESRAEAKVRKAKAAAEAKAKKARLQQQPQVTANIGSSGNCESYRSLVAKYFPASQVNNALLTMKRESGCRTNAVSHTNDHGLMQINYRWHSGKVGGNINKLYDPETNVRIASGIYQASGWRAWYAVRGILW